jgi:gluconokinase
LNDASAAFAGRAVTRFSADTARTNKLRGNIDFSIGSWRLRDFFRRRLFGMATFPKSPKEMIHGMMYFPRMLDKIRLHTRDELDEEYHKNLGAPRTADGACCNFLRVHYRDLRERVLQAGTDEEILEWCFDKGRKPNEGDIFVWNAFVSKLGWRDFTTPALEEQKQKIGIADRSDIATIADMMDFEEGRTKQARE